MHYCIKFTLLAIVSTLLLGCEKSQDATRLKETIIEKRIHFFLNSNLEAKFTAAFDSNGFVRHSARPKGEYYVEGLEIRIKDFENVRLVFSSHTISEGDIFEAFSDSEPSGLEFTITKIEPIQID